MVSYLLDRQLAILKELAEYGSGGVRGAIISGQDFYLLASTPVFSELRPAAKHGFDYFALPYDAAGQLIGDSGHPAGREDAGEAGRLEYIVSAGRELPRILTSLTESDGPAGYSPVVIPSSYTIDYTLKRFGEDIATLGKLLLGALPRAEKYAGRFADTLPLRDLLKLYILSMSDKASPKESYDAFVVADEFRRRVLLFGEKGKNRISSVLKRISEAENLDAL